MRIELLSIETNGDAACEQKFVSTFADEFCPVQSSVSSTKQLTFPMSLGWELESVGIVRRKVFAFLRSWYDEGPNQVKDILVQNCKHKQEIGAGKILEQVVLSSLERVRTVSNRHIP